MASQDTYNAWQIEANKLPGLIAESDPTALQTAIKTGLDNNKDITDAQGRANEAAIQTQSYYNNANNPELMGLDVSSRMRLGDINSSTDRMNSQMLGAYAASRQGSVADAITAWKEAYAIKLKAQEERANQLKEQYSVEYQKEKDAQDRADAAASRAASYAKDNKTTVFDDIDTLINQGVGWGDIVKLSKGAIKTGGDADMYLRYRLIGPEKLLQSGEWKTTLSRMKDLGFYKGYLPSSGGSMTNNGGWSFNDPSTW